MMRRCKTIFCLISALLTGKTYALYQGNPQECELPQQGLLIKEERAVNFKLGYLAERLFSQEMELSSLTGASFEIFNNISSWTSQGVFTLSVIDRLEAFVGLGTINLSLKQKGLAVHSQDGFTWMVGGRATVIRWGSTSLGGAASYLSATPHFNKDPAVLSEFLRGKSVNYNVWQIELALSHKIAWVSLYLGGAYTYTDISLKEKRHLDAVYTNAHKKSLVVGASFFAKKGFIANIEAIVFGQLSLGGNIDLRF